MGVKDLKNVKRLTVYINQIHIDFIEEVIKTLPSSNGNTPSKSDVLRAILNTFVNRKDWKDTAIMNAVENVKERRFCEDAK